jgi:small subunit ribosomal protein S6
MSKYEAMFVLNPDIGKDILDKTLSQIQDIITKNNGSVDEMKEWGKHKLSYPIKKHKEGSYYLMNFHIGADTISVIKRTLGLNESILRTLIVKA